VLEIDLKAVEESGTIAISRVDGNHRLHYGDGKQSGYSRIEKLVSFCLAYGLSREEEIQLFKDMSEDRHRIHAQQIDAVAPS
jgi:hypothetical protein